MKKIYLISIIILLIIIGYSFYNSQLIEYNGVKIKAYAFEDKGSKIGKSGSVWNYIYIYNNKPYFSLISDEKNYYGSCYLIKVNRNFPFQHNTYSIINNNNNKLIFYGLNFGKGFTVKLKRNKSIKHFKFNESFGLENEFSSKVEISIYKNKQILANYSFEFELPRENKFYAIRILPAPKKIQKKIFFLSSGEIKQYVKIL
jgi:hypothetical protein